MNRKRPTVHDILALLGPNGAAFRQTFPGLLRLFQRVKSLPQVAVRYQEWQSYLSVVYGTEVGDDTLFVRHTYLSLLARLVARFFLDVGAGNTLPLLASPDALSKTISGEFFLEQHISNFVEDDFFTWLLAPGIEEGLALVRRLADSLSAYDFSRSQPDLLKRLYEELVDPEARHDLGQYCTPDWLAEYLLETGLALSEDPYRSVLDPACGSGTFLYTAVRLIRAARLAQGEDQFDALLHILDQVMGMDVHPVAVTIARTSYLLALGDLVQGPHPPVLLPVYLSNAIILPSSNSAGVGAYGHTPLQVGNPEPAHTIQTNQPGIVFEVPNSVATNPQMLDWLFSRLTNYLAGAEVRRQVQSEEEATQEVLEAFHNYLLAHKPRTPIPEPLSHFAAEVMIRTAQTLIQLYLEGKDHLWLYILKNLPASIYLSQRKFDLVVGTPPWLPMRDICKPQYREQLRSLILQEYQFLSNQDADLFDKIELATLFFVRCADLHLKDQGRIGTVMPRSVLTAEQHQQFTSFAFKEGGSLMLKLERVLDLEEVSPLFSVPACVLIAQKAQPTTYPVPGIIFKGSLPLPDASWQEAQPQLECTDAAVDRREGRLADVVREGA